MSDVYELEQRYMHNSNETVSTYDVHLIINSKEKLQFNSEWTFNSSINERAIQNDPHKSYNESINVKDTKNFIDIETQRKALEEVEKVFSLIKENINFFQDIIRIYLQKNELKTLLFLFKENLYQRKNNKQYCAEMLNRYTNILNNLKIITNGSGDIK